MRYLKWGDFTHTAKPEGATLLPLQFDDIGVVLGLLPLLQTIQKVTHRVRK